MVARTASTSQSALAKITPAEFNLADLQGVKAHIVARLNATNVRTTTDWTKLGKRRYSIFGVTTAEVKALDKLVRDLRTGR